MEESAFIKCPSCLSEVEISRSSFYKYAGQAVRCPECAAPIPLSGQATWEELSNNQAQDHLPDLHQQSTADLYAAAEVDEAAEGAEVSLPPPSDRDNSPSPPVFSKARKRLSKSLLFLIVALILCSVGLLIFSNAPDLSRLPPTAVQPPVAPATTTTTVPPPAPPPVPVTVIPAPPEPTTEERAATLFAAYRDSFLKGDINAAQSALRNLNSLFASTAARDAFWQKNLGMEAQRSLRIMALCLACVEDKGKCPPCKGQGLCATCAGNKTCVLCKGHSARKKLCPDCTCRSCSASGTCKHCQGTGRVSCQTCGTTGRTQVSVRETCAACGGSGIKAGLRNANGNVAKLPCLTCRARGWIAKTRNMTCTGCEGNGWVGCTDCGGKGVCTACSGKGHKVPCTTCESTGSTTVYCPRCQGTGKCTDCRGTGKCANCRGAGSCPVCLGNGLSEALRFPVAASWLIQDRGYILIDADGALKQAAGASGRVALEHAGRPLSFTLKPNDIAVIVPGDPAAVRAVIRKP